MASDAKGCNKPTITIDENAAPRWSNDEISLLDGDTVVAGGQIYRLVGFDTPEGPQHAQCPSEAARATARLKELLASGKHKLEQVPCSCRPGTEGTPQCNYSRLCAKLTVDGRDVGKILIAEGLAHRYVCGSSSCPRKPGWCR